MKIRIYFLRTKVIFQALTLAIMLFAFNVNAQCPSGDIDFTSQALVDQFIIDYPNCTEINGHLRIGASSDQPATNITSVYPLRNITHVRKNLFINNNALLENLEGLNIVNVDGRVWVGATEPENSNMKLKNIAGLSKINYVGGNIIIRNNPELESLGAFHDLTTIPNFLSIDGNPSLIFVDGFESLSEVGEYVKIENNSSLENLSGFISLKTVGGRFLINSNEKLKTITGFNELLTVKNKFSIDSNKELYLVNGFSNFNKADSIGIGGNGNLTNLDFLSNVTKIDGELKIDFEVKLTDISGIKNIDHTTIKNLDLSFNYDLAICDYDNICAYLSDDTNNYFIYRNAGSCHDEDMLKEACNAVATGCLDANPNLPQWPTSTFTPSCNNSIEEIANNCWTGEYSKVKLIAGVEYTFSSSVTTDYITISDEEGTVIYTFGTGNVTYTPATDETVRFYLHLDENCDYGDQINRSRFVQCNNLSSVDMNSAKLTYYPNPVKDVFNISSDQIIDFVSIIDLTGKTILNKRINSTEAKINMSQLATGNYIVRISSNGIQKTMKVIKN